MHGHPFSGPMQLWWGKAAPAERPRNLFHTLASDIPPATDMFRAGGLISIDGEIENRGCLHRLMARLTERARADDPPGFNPDIPSGYTYLLQFIAHDLVDSVLSYSVDDGDVVPGARNARSQPLMLDTLYGSGPEECPHAYEFTDKQVERGLIPRTRLRVGARGVGAPPSETDPYCPFRDITRLGHPDRTFSGTGKPMLTEAMVADPRNDSHALVSQLTVLFQILHNHVLELLENATRTVPASDRLPPRELALRQFQCARTVVTLIYRNIIEKDVLRRILHRRIHDRYAVEKQRPLDPGEGIPLEFTFGAFRFGHAMVREAYDVNSAFAGQGTRGALERSGQQAHVAGMLPIGGRWLIDWARFFDNDKNIAPNESRLISPHYPDVLTNNTLLFPPKVGGIDTEGLTHRDLLSAAFAGQMSVPALIRSMQEKGFAGVESFDAWQPRIEDWLTEGFFDPDDQALPLLVNDPPLPFFVLFEAAYIGKPETGVLGGRRLGPVGSVIVAETILGAMQKFPAPASGPTLKEAIRRCGEALLGALDPNAPTAPSPFKAAVCGALADIDEIEEMPQLLRYMGRVGIFAQP